MTKKTQNKETGYVPFTREDINLEDGRNTHAEELFLQMLDIPKRVVKKKKKGQEHNITDDDFYPTSAEEVQKMDALMEEVVAAVDDRSDREFMDNIAFMKDVLSWSKTRHWKFAWWIVGCVFIAALYFFYEAGNRADDLKKVESLTEEAIQAQYQQTLDSDIKRVAHHKERIAQATDEATKKEYTEYLESATKLLEERESLGAEGYQKNNIAYESRRVWSSRGSAIWCLVWIVLYIIAERPYGYMISKRRTELQVYTGLRKALFGVAGAFVGMAGALQVTETVTTYASGRKETSSDAVPIAIFKVGLLLAAVLLVLVVARIVIVIATIMGFIRNYDLIALAKKYLQKDNEALKKQTIK